MGFNLFWPVYIVSSLYYCSLYGDTSAVVLFVLCFGVEFLCCLIHSFI